MTKRVLECSSAGDSRFSAFYAKVEIFGVTASIEEHYQLSKRFYNDEDGLYQAKTVRGAKGKRPIEFVVRGLPYRLEYLTAWYAYLWIKYLDDNPKLVKVLEQYDDYSDKFKGRNTINCQADVIRRYMHEGRDSLIKEYGGFYNVIETTKI